ncbi:hypothetical protein [Streptomyces sp. NPDC020681]|uniref:hypothetical protein n=1 Tax=Streptomyces sp. NPDC020681 TaxID=3365083 RepID=UPI0037B4BD11
MGNLALHVPLTRWAGRAPWTVARDTRGGNLVVTLAVIVSCVINGDSLTGVLRQATWLVVAIIALVSVQWVASMRRVSVDDPRPI